MASTGIVRGAANAPIVAPALKIAVASALSFFGKYSAVALIAAGKFPDSPIAKTTREKIINTTLTLIISPTSPPIFINCSIDSRAPANPTNQLPVTIPDVPIPQIACRHAPIDQRKIAQRKPFLVPSQSTNRPANNMAIAYTKEKVPVINP